MFWFFGPTTCGILVPWPGMETAAPALEAQSLNHWTPREFPAWFLLFIPYNNSAQAAWLPSILQMHCLRLRKGKKPDSHPASKVQSRDLNAGPQVFYAVFSRDSGKSWCFWGEWEECKILQGSRPDPKKGPRAQGETCPGNSRCWEPPTSLLQPAIFYRHQTAVWNTTAPIPMTLLEFFHHPHSLKVPVWEIVL